MGFYSRNKLDKLEEMTKIEQKRYEELIVNSRNSNKNIVSVVRASLNKIETKASVGRSEIRKYSAENQRSGTPNAKSLLQDAENRSEMIVQAQNPKPLPMINKKPIGQIRKTEVKADEQLKNQMKMLKMQEKELEMQEKELENDLNDIDAQGYKQRLFESLQAITEEAKEMEESAKGSVFNVLGTGKRFAEGVQSEKVRKNESDKGGSFKGEFGKVEEVKVKQFVMEIKEKNQLEKINEGEGFDQEFEKEKKGLKIDKKYAKRGRGMWRNQDAYGKRGASEGVMMGSQYSDKSKKSAVTKISVKGSKENIENGSKDYVKVNPKIDIKKLLFS